jgi:AcrR family transcriptional regulator
MLVVSAVEAIKRYVEEVRGLADAGTTTETSYYPAIKSLLESVLEYLGLDFQVRTGTAEDRSGGGRDQPDLAIYDSNGDYVVVAGEIKTPQPDLESLAMSTERNDQVGRYLSLTRVVLLFNVRSFGLLKVAPSSVGNERNAPENRVLEQTVEFWATKVGMLRGDALPSDAFQQLSQLIEDALTKLATLGSPESLAKVLARQAKLAKAQLPHEFTTAVSGLADDFREALGVNFEGPEGEEFFRSSLIQTVFYGLFAGWTLWARSGSVTPFRWEDLVSHLRIPFLGELFYELQHPTRIQELGLRPFLSRATETLARVDRESFFERFKTPSLEGFEDDASTAAILYFYEPFLEAFDPELRKELGVWYTPREIVRYQVRYVDMLLRYELGCPLGLADEKVVILDPACGTGAYLIEVLRIIAERLKERGAGALLAEKLLEAVRKRVIGFEILTAPFVIAQLQIYLFLSNLGAPPATGQRPAVFLTNALTGWEGTDQVKLRFPELQEEHDAAKRVKRGGKIIVILGNPPYNRFAGVPLEEEADLADHYKGIVRNDKGKQLGSSRLYTEWGVRKQLLNELYVRFFRLAERCIGERAEFGLVSFITNYSFLGGRSHPLMRERFSPPGRVHGSSYIDCPVSEPIQPAPHPRTPAPNSAPNRPGIAS